MIRKKKETDTRRVAREKRESERPASKVYRVEKKVDASFRLPPPSSTFYAIRTSIHLVINIFTHLTMLLLQNGEDSTLSSAAS